ncbi:uncharacterized protein N7443_005539 [Penicillium atrosanguineum]|uniref:uncharacterized protein n=1 Tax=Penicillium atrosanguineum TaxID=1132637 RepID=UPI0023A1C029|nr:uncharacterized protein N7443_005539 [Penicillium atrosanguineum]KAJ5300537.1 hypothetical protein N7443_005539 [Penicillium atrosanguineum]
MTTETIVVSTTVCLVTEDFRSTSTDLPDSANRGAEESGGSSQKQSTTSTIVHTRTATIKACPSDVVDCPASVKSTYVTTETIVVSTTICPVTATETTSSYSGTTPNHLETAASSVSTSTVLATLISTMNACPSTVTDCPTTFVSSETKVVPTVLITAEWTVISTGVASEITAGETSVTLTGAEVATPVYASSITSGRETHGQPTSTKSTFATSAPAHSVSSKLRIVGTASQSTTGAVRTGSASSKWGLKSLHCSLFLGVASFMLLSFR